MACSLGAAALAKKEGHQTFTHAEDSFMVKLFVAQFFITGAPRHLATRLRLHTPVFIAPGIGIMAAGTFYMLWLNGFSALPSFNPQWYSVVGDFAVSDPLRLSCPWLLIVLSYLADAPYLALLVPRCYALTARQTTTMFAQAIIPKLSTLARFPLTAIRRELAERAMNTLTERCVNFLAYLSSVACPFSVRAFVLFCTVLGCCRRA
jgi:hypothetical protein